MSSSPPLRVGFSLVELMVVISIVGILVTLAVPRYNAFIANARRGEAKSNLSHISMLQSMYKVEHWQHYYGTALTSTGIGNGGSCAKNTPGEGLDNHLGFAPPNCTELRYLYYLVQSSKTAFAYAASDTQGKHIYPDCSGGYRTAECGKTQGDVVSMTLASGKPEVCRNINKYCPTGEGGDPSPCACTCRWDEGTQLTSLTDASRYECQTAIDVRTRTDNKTCTLGPPGCVGGVTSCTPPPPPTTRTVNYNVPVRGTKPIDQYAPTVSNPCGCGAVSPDPRAGCGPCVCSTTPTLCPTTVPSSIANTVANTYTCQPDVTTNINQTRTCTPASDPPCTAPFTSTSPLSCSYPGTKVHDCGNICGAWGAWGAWSECVGGEQQRTRSRTCVNPCAGTPLSCPTEDVQTRSVPCPTPTEKCLTGEGVEITDVSQCPNNGEGYTLEPHPACCLRVVDPTCDPDTECCYNHDDDNTTPEIVRTADSCPAGQRLSPHPVCCVEPPDCDSATHCCGEGNAVIPKPDGLTCKDDEWKGQWNGNNDSCCETDSCPNRCEKQACDSNENGARWSDDDCSCGCPNSSGKGWQQVTGSPSGLLPSLIDSVANLLGVEQCTTAPSWDCLCTDADKEADCVAASTSTNAWDASTKNCNCNDDGLEWVYDESDCSGGCQAKSSVVTECTPSEQACCDSEGNQKTEEDVCRGLGSVARWASDACSCTAQDHDWNFNGHVSCAGTCTERVTECTSCSTPTQCPSSAPSTVDLTSAYTCQTVPATVIVTTECTPADAAICPTHGSTSPLSCPYQGTKELSCDNICPWPDEADSDGTCAESGGKWERTAMYRRTCTNPCTDGTEIMCSNNKSETIACDMCNDRGTYKNMTVSKAIDECQDASGTFAPEGSGTALTCNCTFPDPEDPKCNINSGEYSGYLVATAQYECLATDGNTFSTASDNGSTKCICDKSSTEEEEYNLYITCLTNYIKEFEGRTCEQMEDILEGSMDKNRKDAIIGRLNSLNANAHPDNQEAVDCKRDTQKNITCGNPGADNCCALSVPN